MEESKYLNAADLKVGDTFYSEKAERTVKITEITKTPNHFIVKYMVRQFVKTEIIPLEAKVLSSDYGTSDVKAYVGKDGVNITGLVTNLIFSKTLQTFFAFLILTIIVPLHIILSLELATFMFFVSIALIILFRVLFKFKKIKQSVVFLVDVIVFSANFFMFLLGYIVTAAQNEGFELFNLAALSTAIQFIVLFGIYVVIFKNNNNINK